MTKVELPTPRQQQIINYIYWRHGFDHPVTFQDIADYCGVVKSAAAQHLRSLRKKGYVEWVPLKATTLRLTRLGELTANKTVRVDPDAMEGLAAMVKHNDE